ncbi:MAG: ATP-binding protein, partial [Anaerolineales bacterium]
NFLKYFLENIPVEENDMGLIRKGIIEGLSGKNDFTGAGSFFGFVDTVSPLISPQQATELLDFALDRFELHIDDEYADGGWAKWLNPPEKMSMAFTGFVWSALGSPRAETRWRAAHCIRRLAEIGCDREIHDLIQWMEHDKVDAFGCHKFHFYNLHARQYLLIAFARVSIDHPGILRRYHDIFLQHALSTASGILIRKFSSEIGLNIENMFPNTYSRENVKQLHQVGVSQLPIKKKHHDTDKLESYWHKKGDVDTSLDFHHEFDFDRYWFKPLGEVFGISSEHVEELATEVIINEWCIEMEDGFTRDSRKELWHSSQNDRKTRHSHGGYPQADSYRFYLSYHAMLVVAGKLLQKMHVVHRDEWCEDEWAEWLHRHTLTRTDGHWLSDRRDPAPLLKPNWIFQEEMKNWRTEITGNDFLDMLLIERKDETWLNVFGTWEESDYKREESVYISTALVVPEASQSLLNALTTCSNPHDFKLPDYQEERLEFQSFPFELKGWIWRKYKDNRLDEYDPYAGQLNFPPFDVGQSIVEKMGLSADSEKREWFLTG